MNKTALVAMEKKEDRKEAETEVSMKLCLQIGFCLPGRYPLVFIDEEHQLQLFFEYKCRSDRVEYAQNFNLLLSRLGKQATSYIISASNFRISYLWLLRVLTLCSIIF